MPAGARAERYARQDRLFSALERLESKDTQDSAFAELKLLIREMEPPVLSTLLHAAGSQTAKSSQFSKVHCLRLAALCTTPAACLQWQAMLAPPLLGKLLALLSRALRDADGAVRAASGECFGSVAAQLAAVGGSTGSASNPLLACLLDALGEPGAAVQSAAAAALAQAADSLPPLEQGPLLQLLHALDSPLCLGRAELCLAFARCDGEGRAHGLAVSSRQPLLSLMPRLLGSAAEATGLLGALASRGKDFQLRASAAMALKALAVAVGPSLASGWQEVSSALRTAKHDVSKPVREAAAGALPLVQGLLEFLASGGCPEQWPAASASLLAAGPGRAERGRLSGRPAAQHSAVCQETTPSSPPIPAYCGAMSAGGGAVDAASPCCSQPHVAGSSASPPPSLSPAAPSPALQPDGASPAAVASPAAAAVQPEQPLAGQQLAAQLAAIQDQQASLASALKALSSSTEEALRHLLMRLDCVDAGVAALSRVGGGSGLEALAGPQVPRKADCAQEVPAGCQCKRLSSLHRSFQALEQHLHPASPAQPPPQPWLPPQQAVDAVPAEADHAHGSAGPQQASVPRRSDWNAAYARLLGGGGSCGTAQQLQLLRAMAKSGPVWEQLERPTGHLLLAAIATLLGGGVSLKRLLPWLWPLTDAASAGGAAARRYLPELRGDLLAALAACEVPAAAGAEAAQGQDAGGCPPERLPLAEQRDLLLSRLRANWS